ncbi:hypothetical protein [Capnocytophaga sputigena]|uniref:hypothetical protein n=1 Tax=Capnocytophaga sputigena TaxID=1019 RepID=UPI0028D020E8|nr:hypothetical protein [Capnocytophaga sputigena]
MKNTNLKLLVLALVGLFLTNCQRDDAPEVLPQEEAVPALDPQAVVSLNEAKSLFEASENQKRTTNSVSRSRQPFVELETDWQYFLQTQTLAGDAYAKIPITIIGSDLSAEMLFLKENGITEQYLFITEPDSLTNDNRIVNADFYLLTPKGEFISAYRMTDGVISHQLVPKVKANYRLVVDTEVTPTGKKKPRKTPPLESIEDPNNKKEDSGGLDDYEGGGDGDDDPIQLDPVDVYGTIPAHYGSYPTYNGNNYENFTKEKDPKPSENGTGGGNGGSSSSDVGVGIVKGGKKSKNIRTIDDEEKEEKERKKQYKREDTIKDSLTNPCAKSLLVQAPNLNNDIAKILRETFGTNDRFNITVHNKSFATDPKHKKDVAYTETIGRVDSYNKDILICDIYLNDDIISKASQEYILGTIYHEVVHAFLNTESLSLGKESFNKKYPFVKEQYLSIGGEQVRRYVFLDSHERFAPFIDNLARGILSLPNTKVSMEEAIALAKAGVVENKSLSSTEIYLDGEFKSGRKGITCTP